MIQIIPCWRVKIFFDGNEGSCEFKVYDNSLSAVNQLLSKMDFGDPIQVVITSYTPSNNVTITGSTVFNNGM